MTEREAVEAVVRLLSPFTPRETVSIISTAGAILGFYVIDEDEEPLEVEQRLQLYGGIQIKER